jgi:hypothetical protein
MKRKIKMLKAFTGAQADTAKGKAMSPGTSATGGTRESKGEGSSKIGPVVKDVPFKKPFGTKSKIAATLLGIGPVTTVGNIAAKNTYKSRQNFAKKKGLYRDFYKTTGNTLQPNSPIGKNYLKDAGFNKKTPTTPDRDRNNTTVETTKPIDPLLIKPKENFFNFKAYNVGGLSGGVSYGPPPKRGPNSQVPPVKLKKGSKK